MLIVSLTGKPDGFESDPVDEAFWSLPEGIVPTGARRRLTAERLEAVDNRTQVDAELVQEGVLDSELLDLLYQEGVAWRRRSSQVDSFATLVSSGSRQVTA